MKRPLVVAGNALLVAVMLAWGVYLLGMVRSKADYITGRVGDTVLPCAWIPLSDPALSTLGLSHEEHHSWEDRATAYIAFRTPPMPAGGTLEISLVALLGKRVDMRLRGEGAKQRMKHPGNYAIALEPAEHARVRLLELKTRGMQPPTPQDSRWLGAAFGQIRSCAAVEG